MGFEIGPLADGVDGEVEPSPQPTDPRQPRARPVANAKLAARRARLVGCAAWLAEGAGVVDLMTVTWC